MQESSTRLRSPAPDKKPRGGFEVAIVLAVDATDVQRGIVAVTQTLHLPQGGRMTLLYPEWLPGYHAPRAPIDQLAGLHIRSAGRTVSWQRDPIHVHAFHIEAPATPEPLLIGFQLLSPTAPEQGRVGITSRQLNLQWNALLLYPEGYRSDQIGVSAKVRLPDGWGFASALAPQNRAASNISFPQTALDVLVDSPVFAGRQHRRYQIEESVALNIFSDDERAIDVSAGLLSAIKGLVIQADRLFAARPFQHYDFLVAVSDELGDLGVEHRQSAELVLPPDFFAGGDETRSGNDVLAHEYVHAWNGKFRKGRGACIASFDQPIRNDLLWVYEGLTQYWGQVLATRAGLWDAPLFRDALALIAARCCNMKGRRWRPLRDTTRDPIVSERQLPWESWQRNQDYYTDGQLLWLEVDGVLRQESRGTRSLDDFGRNFFGLCSSTSSILPYGFEDIVNALDELVAYDWRGFFDHRLDGCEPGMALDAITKAGYQIQYRDRRSTFHRLTDGQSGLIDLTFSAGFSATPEGKIKEVIWDSAAFHAALTAGAEVLAVNDKPFSAGALCAAVADKDPAGICLWIQKLKHCQTINIPYSEGHRFPHLVRLEDKPALLDAILDPRQ